MITKEKYAAMMNVLVTRFLDKGREARLNAATLAEIAGVSRARLGSLRQKPDTSGFTLLRLKQGLEKIEEGLAEEWLPCSTRKGEPQETAKRRIMGLHDDRDDMER